MANPKSTQLWFGKARQDLSAAKVLTSLKKDGFGSTVFHAQQCAEKAMKGFLTHHNIRVLKTHDMDKLLASLSKINSNLAKDFSAVSTFTKYAVEYRYPDAELDLPPLTSSIVTDAIELAEKVYTQLAALINVPEESD